MIWAELLQSIVLAVRICSRLGQENDAIQHGDILADLVTPASGFSELRRENEQYYIDSDDH